MWTTTDFDVQGIDGQKNSQIRLYQWQEIGIGGLYEWVEFDTVDTGATSAWSLNFDVFDYPGFGRPYFCFSPSGPVVGFGWLGFHRAELLVNGIVVDTHDFVFVHDCVLPGLGN